MAIKQKKSIKYTSRDFNSIKNDLLDYKKRYYGNISRDQNDASFDSMIIDLISLIGDSLSFNLDYAINESFLDSALQPDSIIRHGKSLGYKFKNNTSSYGNGTLYITVPAKSFGLGPNSNYIPRLIKGSEFSTNSGISFILNENVDFSNSSNEVVVAAIDDTTGIPSSYAIKATGRVLSGEISIQNITITDYIPFLRLQLNGSNIAEVLSVSDSEGHTYYEVENLSQDVIYKELVNRDSNKDTVRSILKPISVPRRYVVEQETNNTFIQFGYGSAEEIKLNSIADPSSVILKFHGKDYTTDSSFDPQKLNSTDKFGVVPSNTTLTIITRNNTSENVNASVGTIVNVNTAIWEFDNEGSLNSNVVSNIKASLEVNNEEPIVGDVSLPSNEEIRRRIYDTYASQNRAVTKQDYLSIIYNMPPEYGAIKRANITQDPDSFKRNLNLYVVSEDATGILVQTNRTIKENLKTWINSKKMLNDTIDILDATIINIGIYFEAIAIDEKNKYDALQEGIGILQDYYVNKLDIGENFSISKIYSLLKLANSILDVTNVKLINNRGGIYSDSYYNIENNMSSDGRELIAQENMIFEIRYLTQDIKGSIK